MMQRQLLLLLVLLSTAYSLQDTCKKQEDCRALSECDSDECIHKVLSDPAPSEYVGIFIIFIFCAFGAGTGLGGGPLMTPIFILIWFFSAHDAIPLSQTVIFSASLTTIYFRIQERNSKVDRPLIDWDLLILLQPPIICGALFGVLINFTFPEWLILILLEMLLIFITYKTAIKTIQNRKKENEAMKAAAESVPTEMNPLEPKSIEPTDRPLRSDDSDNPDSDNSGNEDVIQSQSTEEKPKIVVEEEKSPGRLEIERRFKAKLPWRQATIVVCTHIFMVIAILIRGGMGAKSIAELGQCSPGFMAWIPLFILICTAIGLCNSIYVYRNYQWQLQEKYPLLDEDIKWTPKKMSQFMLLAICAGTCSGALGAGGGTTMGPLLLLLGVNPQVTSSTSAVLVFYTASIASLTYALAGRIPLDYGLLMLFMCLFAGAAGVMAVRWLVIKFKRLSVITLIMTIFLSLAAIGILIYGITSTVSKANRGILNAKFNDLCSYS